VSCMACVCFLPFGFLAWFFGLFYAARNCTRVEHDRCVRLTTSPPCVSRLSRQREILHISQHDTSPRSVMVRALLLLHAPVGGESLASFPVSLPPDEDSLYTRDTRQQVTEPVCTLQFCRGTSSSDVGQLRPQPHGATSQGHN
jgi:hypothetical protein